jgi:hypothetical protein
MEIWIGPLLATFEKFYNAGLQKSRTYKIGITVGVRRIPMKPSSDFDPAQKFKWTKVAKKSTHKSPFHEMEIRLYADFKNMRREARKVYSHWMRIQAVKSFGTLKIKTQRSGVTHISKALLVGCADSSSTKTLSSGNENTEKRKLPKNVCRFSKSFWRS